MQVKRMLDRCLRARKIEEIKMADKEITVQKATNLIVFISHDTRDAELAEAFSTLLKSVSAGVLKSFRSSDKKDNQGIEFGLEWYPEIIKNIGIVNSSAVPKYPKCI